MSTVSDISAELDAIRAQSLWKTERPILGHQSSHIAVTSGREVLNFCANNYLGLADHPALVAAAKEALDSHGLGMASVRFICGTSDLHLALERRIAGYLGMDDAILFAACFDANGAVFEPLFGTPHGCDLSAVSRTCGVEDCVAGSLEEVASLTASTLSMPPGRA